MKKNLFVIWLISCFMQIHLQAQDKSDIKFGKISQADFNLSTAKFDSGANAVIIADIGNTHFQGNNHGSFMPVRKLDNLH